MSNQEKTVSTIIHSNYTGIPFISILSASLSGIKSYPCVRYNAPLIKYVPCSSSYRCLSRQQRRRTIHDHIAPDSFFQWAKINTNYLMVSLWMKYDEACIVFSRCLDIQFNPVTECLVIRNTNCGLLAFHNPCSISVNSEFWCIAPHSKQTPRLFSAVGTKANIDMQEFWSPFDTWITPQVPVICSFQGSTYTLYSTTYTFRVNLYVIQSIYFST